jgi:hypothetical protein
MRKYLIKYFALDYIVRVFGTTQRWVRAANIIFPALMAAAIAGMVDSWLMWVFLAIFAVAVYFGFFHFLIYPITEKDYEYLDEGQKWTWNLHNQKPNFTLEKYNSQWYFWEIPILVTSFFIYYLLC